MDDKKKKEIGQRLMECRKKYVASTRPETLEKMDITFNMLLNAETGRTLPRLWLLAYFANISGSSVNYLINGEEFGTKLTASDVEMIIELSDKERFDLLIHGLCFKMKNDSLYDRNLIKQMDNEYFTKKIRGYMLKIQREFKGVTYKELKNVLNVNENTLKRIESGDTGLATEKWYLICEYLNIPMDVLMVRELENKQKIEEYLLHELLYEGSDIDVENMKEYIISCKEIMKIR